jgi:hypothetical protein
LKPDDWCVIRKDFYLDYGQMTKVASAPSSKELEKGDIPKIQRKATVVDQGKAHENEMRCKSACAHRSSS